VSNEPDEARYKMIQSHLVTRAVENTMYIVSSNSISKNQTAPTCIINPDGNILQQTQTNKEQLLYFDFGKEESNFGRNGRRIHSKELLGMNRDTNE
jgi:omega-amidase